MRRSTERVRILGRVRRVIVYIRENDEVLGVN